MVRKGRGNKRRRGAGTRKESPAVLVAVQGSVTEREYFSRLKRDLKLSSLQVYPVPVDASGMVADVKNRIPRDKNAPYSRIFFVADLDDFSKEQIWSAIKESKDLESNGTRRSFVISNECFEVWLLAHFENIKDRSFPRDTLRRKLKEYKAIEGNDYKHISEGFPMGSWRQAVKNVDSPGFDQIGASCGTAVASMVAELAANQRIP